MGDVTAGKTWAASETVTPTKLNQMLGDSELAVGIVQIVTAAIIELDAVSASMPPLGTPPATTDGEKIFEQAITPRTTSSRVLVALSINVRQYDIPATSNGSVIVALFRGTTLIGVRYLDDYNASGSGKAAAGVVTFLLLDTPASAAPVTYSARIGCAGSGRNVDVNNISSASLPGGPALLLEMVG